jgi:hypothetical protein
VGIDRPDDPDVPPDKHSDPPADSGQPETRYRQECYDDLRAATEARTEPVGRSEPGARSKPEQPTDPAKRSEPEAQPSAAKQTENGQRAQPGTSWEERAELSRWMWTEYKRRWPPEERPPVDRSKDPPGSWRGDNVRFLSISVNAELERECDHIADRERETEAYSGHPVEVQANYR